MSTQTDHTQTRPERSRRVVPGRPIPAPENFAVTWENPDDQRLLWVLDNYHYPDALAPLVFELIAAIYEDGGTRAATEFSMPFRMMGRRINTYFFRATIPIGAPPDGVVRLMNQVKRFAPGVMGAIESKATSTMTKKYLVRLDPVLDDLEAYWGETLLPEVKQYLAEWEAFDLEQATTADLLAHLDRVMTQAERIGTIHFLIHLPNVFAMSQFEELFCDLFGSDSSGVDGSLAAFRLLQGFDNMILAGDRMLWDLGRKALTMPAVQEILEEKAAADVLPALEGSAAGQVFLQELDAFLREHGQRGAMFSAIGEVSWIEDPTPVVRMLQDYITQPDRDPQAELAAEAAERERLLNKARARLKGYPQPVVDEFERLLKAAQTATVLYSDHGYWVDYRAMYNVRRVLLAFGRRLTAAGAIDAPEDVLFLWLGELKAAAKDPSRARKQEVVAERKAEMAHFRAIKPPAMLGTMPLTPPPPDEPMVRAHAKTWEGMAVAASGGDPGVLRGNAGSPGLVRGPAKVMRSLADAGKLQPGDILVAETTAPPWTPLFATAAAVVTDAGGVLSHCAVVAREYRIPAVVGADRATATIQDGQMIEVNGDAGVVKILEWS
jgi:pyruvate,water dikinase